MNFKVYIADKIFTGEGWLTGQAILVEDGIIHSIVPENNIPLKATIINYKNSFFAPAFIDLQIYGA